jgi:hypothetical protein
MLDSLWSRGLLDNLRYAAKEVHNQNETLPATETEIEGL